MKYSTLPALAALFAGLFVFAGCDEIDSSRSSDGPQPVEISGLPPDLGDGHDAPHGGHIIELGRNHKYHAELVEDEQAETVGVYILDGDLQELPIEQTTIVLNLTTSGKTTTFELASANPGGPSAEFRAADPALFHALHAEDAVAKLRVAIQGATYVGTLDHHEHDCDCEHEH